MAEYKIESGKVGAHDKTLGANVVDSIVFAAAVPAVAVFSDGTAWVYGTTDGSEPVIGAPGTFAIPPTPSVMTLDLRGDATVEKGRVIKLVSAGTPSYDVSVCAPPAVSAL